MEAIYAAPASKAQGGAAASIGTTIVAAATNVRGIIVYSTFWYWYATAVGNVLEAFLQCGGGALFNSVYDDTAAAGPAAVVRSALFQTPIRAPAGFDLTVNIQFAAGYRASYAITYKVL